MEGDSNEGDLESYDEGGDIPWPQRKGKILTNWGKVLEE